MPDNGFLQLTECSVISPTGKIYLYQDLKVDPLAINALSPGFFEGTGAFIGLVTGAGHHLRESYPEMVVRLAVFGISFCSCGLKNCQHKRKEKQDVA